VGHLKRDEINSIYTSFLETTKEFYETVGTVQSMAILVFFEHDKPDSEPLALPMGISPGDEPDFETMFTSIVASHPPQKFGLEFALFLGGMDTYEGEDRIVVAIRDTGGSVVHTTWKKSELGNFLEEDKSEGKYHWSWVPGNEKTYRLLSKDQKVAYDFLKNIIVDYNMAASVKTIGE
jgi:hypothetical protein